MYTVGVGHVHDSFFPIQEKCFVIVPSDSFCTFYTCSLHVCLIGLCGCNKNAPACTAWLFDDIVYRMLCELLCPWISEPTSGTVPGFWLWIWAVSIHSVIICLDLEVWRSLPESDYFNLQSESLLKTHFPLRQTFVTFFSQQDFDMYFNVGYILHLQHECSLVGV